MILLVLCILFVSLIASILLVFFIENIVSILYFAIFMACIIPRPAFTSIKAAKTLDHLQLLFFKFRQCCISTLQYRHLVVVRDPSCILMFSIFFPSTIYTHYIPQVEFHCFCCVLFIFKSFQLILFFADLMYGFKLHIFIS